MSVPSFTTGSNILQKTLPCFPGYAMGGIIRTGELELPYLEQQTIDLLKKIETIKTQKESLKNASLEQKDLSQKQIIIYSHEVQRLEEMIKKIAKQIETYQKEKEESPFSETMLPIDYYQSHLDIRHRYDESENMHFVVLNKTSPQKQIEAFTNHLTNMRYLPAVVDLIDQISSSILNQTEVKNQEVCLLGSFVTLSHVRVIDPIIIRKDATLSQKFSDQETVSKYSVITESVLGGVFIGFGTRISKHSESTSKSLEDIKTTASNLTAFSFVSQGAIPDTEQFNLWDTYNNWKKKITSDPHCGFPIAFKVRSLTDVLKENNRL
jgi:hypothetical protein